MVDYRRSGIVWGESCRPEAEKLVGISLRYFRLLEEKVCQLKPYAGTEWGPIIIVFWRRRGGRCPR